jgi:exopolysaccharide biosynthesis polyprenyl glycosylphosphotransferase
MQPTLQRTAWVEARADVRSRPARVRTWERRYVSLLLCAHVVAVGMATLAAYGLRFGILAAEGGQESEVFSQGHVNYALVALAIALGWLLALHAAGSYEPRFLAVGAEEFKRLLRASLWVLAGIAVVCYALKVDVARGFVAAVIPVGFAMLAAASWLVRRWVYAQRRVGDACYRILAVGTRLSVDHLAAEIARAPLSGLRVVGACIPEEEGREPVGGSVPVVGDLPDAVEAATRLDVDVVSTAGSHMIGPEYIRSLGWALEGTGRKLVLAPDLTNVAGPRISVTPVSGLPLVWVDEPTFTGMRRVGKRLLDVGGAAALLVLLSPVLLLTAMTVKLSSRGPVFFRQRRTGTRGVEFRVWKFRSMYVDAEARRAELVARHNPDRHLFKVADDPRVTPVGRVLRRLSLDELPQLFNVLRGEMSLVGPRPLPVEDSDYRGLARRRLLVRPGITGLWQVSGRSDIAWDEAVRLDLYYVENWSFALDLAILVRTFWAVLRGNGAY